MSAEKRARRRHLGGSRQSEIMKGGSIRVRTCTGYCISKCRHVVSMQGRECSESKGGRVRDEGMVSSEGVAELLKCYLMRWERTRCSLVLNG